MGAPKFEVQHLGQMTDGTERYRVTTAGPIGNAEVWHHEDDTYSCCGCTRQTNACPHVQAVRRRANPITATPAAPVEAPTGKLRRDHGNLCAAVAEIRRLAHSSPPYCISAQEIDRLLLQFVPDFTSPLLPRALPPQLPALPTAPTVRRGNEAVCHQPQSRPARRRKR